MSRRLPIDTPQKRVTRRNVASVWRVISDFVTGGDVIYTVAESPIDTPQKRAARQDTASTWRVVRDFVIGGDAIYTIAKAIYVIVFAISFLTPLGALFSGTTLSAATLGSLGTLLASSLIPVAPIIIGLGLLGSLLYIISGRREENDLNKEENDLHEKLERVELEAETADRLAQENLGESYKNSLPLKYLSEKVLLKDFLKDYLKRLSVLNVPLNKEEVIQDILDKQKKKSNLLPGQRGILELIESTFEVDSANKQKFADKLYYELGDSDLYHRLRIAFNFNQPSSEPYQPAPAEQKGFFRKIAIIIKSNIFAAARGNTGLGLWVGPLLITGTLTAGFPAGWIVLLVGAVVAGLSGMASLIYKNKVERPYKRNIVALNAEIKRQNNRIAILSKIKNSYSKSQYKNVAEKMTGSSEPDLSKAIPISTKARIAADSVINSLYGASVGMVIGISITLILSVLVVPYFPLLAFPLVGGIMTLTTVGAAVGGVLSLRYSWIMGKGSYLAGKNEQESVLEVTKKREWLKKSFSERQVNWRLELSKQELVIELIERYIVLDKNKILSKKEKVLRVIEEVIKEVIEENGEKRKVDRNDPKFFADVACWLKDNPRTKSYADDMASELKKAVTGDKTRITTTVDQRNLSLVARLKNSLKKSWYNFNITEVNRWVNRHIFGIFGSLGVAGPLGFMLFGPFALVPVAIVATTVMTLVVAHKYFESQQRDNLEEYNAIAAQLPIIDRILKFKEKGPAKEKRIAPKTKEFKSKAIARITAKAGFFAPKKQPVSSDSAELRNTITPSVYSQYAVGNKCSESAGAMVAHGVKNTDTGTSLGFFSDIPPSSGSLDAIPPGNGNISELSVGNLALPTLSSPPVTISTSSSS